MSTAFGTGGILWSDAFGYADGNLTTVGAAKWDGVMVTGQDSLRVVTGKAAPQTDGTTYDGASTAATFSIAASPPGGAITPGVSGEGFDVIAYGVDKGSGDQVPTFLHFLAAPGSAPNSYALNVRSMTGTDEVRLSRQTNGSYTPLLITTSTGEWVNGEDVGLRIMPSGDISIYRRASGGAWTLIDTANDTTYKTGKLGLEGIHSLSRWDGVEVRTTAEDAQAEVTFDAVAEMTAEMISATEDFDIGFDAAAELVGEAGQPDGKFGEPDPMSLGAVFSLELAPPGSTIVGGYHPDDPAWHPDTPEFHPDGIVIPGGLPPPPEGGGGVLPPLTVVPGLRDLRATLSLRVRPAGSGWIELGAGGRGGGAAPVQVTLQADAGGPTAASFALSRELGAQVNRDLQAMTEVEAEVSGAVVWGGRVQSPPGREDSLRVSAQGWQYHLHDDALSRTFMTTGFTRWRSLKDYPTGIDPATTITSEVSGGAQPTFGWNQGSYVPGGAGAGIWIDLGPGQGVSAWWLTAFRQSIGVPGTLHLRGATTAAGLWAGPYHDVLVDNVTRGFWNQRGGFPEPVRFITIFHVYSGTGGVAAATELIRCSHIRLSSDASYINGIGGSALTGPDVIKAVLPFAPSLSSSVAAVDPLAKATFPIPELALDDQPPRAYMDAVNSYYGWRLGIDPRRRLFFIPQATVAEVAIGGWGGSEVTGLAPGAVEELFNRVIVRGTDSGGDRIRVVRSRYVAPLNTRGVTRTATLDVGSITTTQGLELIGDAWLAENGRIAYRGSARISVGGARHLASGAPLHPAMLLLYAGRRLRILNDIDPETGQLGRDVLIAAVDYSDDSETAVLSLDREVRRLEPFLARLAVVTDERVSAIART